MSSQQVVTAELADRLQAAAQLGPRILLLLCQRIEVAQPVTEVAVEIRHAPDGDHLATCIELGRLRRLVDVDEPLRIGHTRAWYCATSALCECSGATRGTMKTSPSTISTGIASAPTPWSSRRGRARPPALHASATSSANAGSPGSTYVNRMLPANVKNTGEASIHSQRYARQPSSRAGARRMPLRRICQSMPSHTAHHGSVARIDSEPDHAARTRMRGAEHVALPSAHRVALPVLADEKVIEKARRARFGEQIPRHGQHGGEREAGNPRHSSPHVAEPALPQRPEADRGRRQHDADRPLREQPDRETHEERVAPDARPRGPRGHRLPEAGHRQRRAEESAGSVITAPAEMKKSGVVNSTSAA